MKPNVSWPASGRPFEILTSPLSTRKQVSPGAFSSNITSPGAKVARCSSILAAASDSCGIARSKAFSFNLMSVVSGISPPVTQTFASMRIDPAELRQPHLARQVGGQESGGGRTSADQCVVGACQRVGGLHLVALLREA